MGFGTFALISLIYAVIGIRVVGEIIRNRREAFDRTFTDSDRHLVDQAAFFILLPISVALHEFGHAVAIWSLGGEVTDFGFYVFAGFVSYAEPFSDAERVLVAAAGPLVNVILSALAIGYVFLRRPPMRAAYNELLIQFAILSGANALIFYPLLDFATGLNGDWRQMYFGDVPALSAVILVCHGGILVLGYWASKSPGMRRRLGVLTGFPPGVDRGLFGDIRRAARPGRGADPAAPTLTTLEQAMQNAARRVVSGWPAKVQGGIERRDGASTLSLRWSGDDASRAIVVRVASGGETDLWGFAQPARPVPGVPLPQLQIQRWPAPPDEDALTLALRLAMEIVDGWQTTPPLPAAGEADGE